MNKQTLLAGCFSLFALLGQAGCHNKEIPKWE